MSATASATKQPEKLHRIAKIALWMVATLIILIGLAALWVWNNRYDLIERQAITYLETLDIQAELDIHSADRTSADIRNIRLSQDNQTFLSVNHLQAAYQWRDLLEGRVERLEFTGLDAFVTLNERGDIIDGWRPPASDNPDDNFPKDGIHINQGALTVRTPFGDIPYSGDMRLDSLDLFSLDGHIGQTRLKRDNLDASFSGPVTLQREGDVIDIDAQFAAVSVNHPAGQVQRTNIDLSGLYDLTGQSAKGRMTLSGGQFAANSGPSGDIKELELDGLWQDKSFAGELNAELENFRIPDAERRLALASSLALANSLSAVPIAQNFAPSLVPPLEDLLSGAEVSASLSIVLDERQRSLSLREPLSLASDRTEISLTPLSNTDFYHYALGSGQFQIGTNVSLSRPVPLQLSDLQIDVRSPDGFRIEEVSQAKGLVKTRQTWTSQTRDERPARLRPFTIGFDYLPAETGARQMSLSGSAHYDGDIPGGYVDGLKAGGQVTAQLRETGPEVYFSPRQDLTFDQMETTSDWIIENFEAMLSPGKPLYVNGPGRPAKIMTSLSDASFTARRPANENADEAVLNISMGSADLSGIIGTNQQDWEGSLTALAIQSETFPVIGTDLTVPTGSFTISLFEDASSQFTFETPSGTLKTPAYTISDMALGAAGTSEQYALNYQGGLVTLIPQAGTAMSIPAMPMTGSLTFEGGLFSGQAETSLPRAAESPIMVDYRFGPEGGDAEVTIEDLKFRPGRLQPQDLARTFRGKIAEVNGTVDATLNLQFGNDAPLQGSGIIQIFDTSLGTAPGPVSGLSGTVELTSLFPVVTAPDQRLQIQSFNPGFPLENGELIYALVPEGVSIASAIFPLGDGQVSFDPFNWSYGAEENRATLRVSEVEVGDFLKGFGEGRLAISGTMEGTIPVVVRGIDVLVEKGRLEVPQGGKVQYTPKELPAALSESAASTALQALENFDYQALFIEIDGPLDGDMLLGLDFGGSNPEVLFGTPFDFAVTVEGELFNIAQSLNPNGLQQRAITTITEKVPQR